jgi:hypothetical protein
MSIRRRLSSIAIVLGILAGSLGVAVDLSASSHSRHLANCSTCPRPPEQPR